MPRTFGPAGPVLIGLAVAMGLAGCGDVVRAGGEAPTISVRPESTPRTPTDAATTSAGTTISPAESDEPADGGAKSPKSPGADGSSRSPAAPADGDLSSPPSSYDDAVAQIAEARRQDVGSREQSIFRTAEDIYCALGDSVRNPTCELPQQAGVKDAAACGNAPSEHVGRIEIMRRGATPVCNTDTIRESVPDAVGAPTLLSQGGVACVVIDSGVTCVAPDQGAAFHLGLGEYAVFAR